MGVVNKKHQQGRALQKMSKIKRKTILTGFEI